MMGVQEKQTRTGIYKKTLRAQRAAERMVQLKCYFYQFHFSVGRHTHTHTFIYKHTRRFFFFFFSSQSHPCLSASPYLNGPYTQLLRINLPLNI